MADYGIVQEGFIRKTYQDIISDMESRAKANFGESIVTDLNKPFGKFLNIHAWEIAELWESLENLYNGFNIDTAEGTQLDILVKWKGILRKQEQTATGQLRVYGISGLVIPLNFIVSKDNGIQYYTITTGTISDTGYATVNIQAQVSGSRGNADVGEVKNINTPITGVTSVTNIYMITNGQDLESDSELRYRYKTETGGLSTVESIRSTVAAVPGVSACRVIENYTEETVNNIPPKSIQVYVYGGDDYDIALAILNSKAAGIRPYGTTSQVVLDQNGFEHTIGFSRIDEVEVIVNITITINQLFSQTDVNTIKDNIVMYVGGESTDGTKYPGLDINTYVIYSYLSSLLWSVRGIEDAQVTIGTSTISQGESNIAIGEFEKAICNATDITITQIDPTVEG